VLRIRSRPPIGHLIEQVVLTAVGVFDDRRVLFAHVPLAQVIEAQVRHDPINPGVEGTLEPETSNVLVSLQEGVLVDVLGILLGSGEMEGEPQYRLVVMTDKFLEGGAVSALGLSDQHRVVYTAFLPSHAAPRGLFVNADSLSLSSLSRAGPITNRKWYYQYTCRHVLSCPLPPSICRIRACTGIDGLSAKP